MGVDSLQIGNWPVKLCCNQIAIQLLVSSGGQELLGLVCQHVGLLPLPLRAPPAYGQLRLAGGRMEDQNDCWLPFPSPSAPHLLPVPHRLANAPFFLACIDDHCCCLVLTVCKHCASPVRCTA